MSQETASTRQPSNAYQIFILVLTVLSLAVMVMMILPIAAETRHLLTFYDNLICFVFLIDFVLNLRGAKRKSDYFIKERGWLDLLGSIPTLGFTQYGGLLRLARLSRLARITRLLRGQNKRALVADVLANRSQYVGFITVLLTVIVLTVTSVLVLEFESGTPDSNIKTGWDSFWYSVVTITTVGYGDRYPVTTAGRLTAMFIMLAGVGSIGVLASLMSSLLIGQTPASEAEPGPESVSPPAAEQELNVIKQKLTHIENELAAMHQKLEKMSGDGKQKQPIEITK